MSTQQEPEPALEAPFDRLTVRVDRLGLVLAPDGERDEAGGVLNPAGARAPSGELLLYPRCVEPGNISRVGLARTRALERGFDVERLGYVLEPETEYEIRSRPGGYGCEDPRVTFVAVLESYVMTYTAFGPLGPRIALAISKDAYHWERLGLVSFAAGTTSGDDKDAAFFPEPVLSPGGVRSLAFYHRPMLHLSAVDGHAAIPMIERMPLEDRESIRIAYVNLEDVLKDRSNLLHVTESVLALAPSPLWGSLKIGAGTPPVRWEDGWMSLYHGVDVIGGDGGKPSLRYSAGIMIADVERPDRILYRSPEPVLVPASESERVGVVNNVVFPTALDERADLGHGIYDVYYGMGDHSIGAARMRLAL